MKHSSIPLSAHQRRTSGPRWWFKLSKITFDRLVVAEEVRRWPSGYEERARRLCEPQCARRVVVAERVPAEELPGAVSVYANAETFSSCNSVTGPCPSFRLPSRVMMQVH